MRSEFADNHGMQILLADESFMDATRLMAHLIDTHQILHALDANMAVQMFREHRPDLLILALRIPQGTGRQIAEDIRPLDAERTLHNPLLGTPIVYLSDAESVDDILAAYASGAAAVISKHVDSRLFAAQIDALTRMMAARERLIDAYLHFETMAMRDHLTRLYNRRYMDMQVDKLWDAAAKKGEHIGLLMLDVDNFKRYNDTYGHAEGDACLSQVADCIARAVQDCNQDSLPARAPAFAARYGGEEFSIVIPAATPAILQATADQVHRQTAALARPHSANANHGHVTVSIGGCCFLPLEHLHISSAFRKADEALYEAKKNGRNCSVFA